MIKIYNVMEELVQHQIEEMIENFPKLCRCEQCVADIMAISLNNLRPRYISSEKGEVMARIMSTTDREKINLLREVTSAVEKVMESPHHSGIPDVTAHTTITIEKQR